MILELTYNIALLVALLAVYQVLLRNLKPGTLFNRTLSGGLFGVVAILGMMTPLHFAPGVIYDGRSIVLSVAGLFGGPLTVGIAAVLAGGFRLWKGGGGTFAGAGTVVVAAGLGVLFYYLRRRDERVMRSLPLLGFGLVVTAGMLILQLLIPGSVGIDVIRRLGPAIIIIYPLATLAVSLLLLDGEKRISAENALKRSEERYRILVDNAFNAIYYLKGKHYEYVNPRFCEITGYSFEELTSPDFDFNVLLTEESQQVIQKRYQARLQEESLPPTYEFQIKRKNGELSYVEVNTVPLGFKGEVEVIGILRDITEKKRAEAELQKSEEQYRLLAETTSDIIVLISLDWHVLYVNQAGLKFSGYRREEALGKPVDRFIAPEYHEKMKDLRRQRIEGNTDAFCYQAEFINGNKERVPVEVSSSPVVEEGRVTKVLIIARDISERVKAEAEKEKLQAQLLQVQKMEAVGRLAGGVAHDFNNMLQVILGNIEMAQAIAGEDEQLRFHMQEINKAAKHSAQLTSQLLAYARRQVATPRVLNLNDTVSAMLDMLESLIGEDIDLVWKPAEDPWKVYLDAGQVDQILVNLVVNARDSISSVGRITIETGNVTLDEDYYAEHPDFHPGEYVMLVVSDDGVGMDTETMKNIFEPFFTTKGVGEGTGMGLATVYGIVKQNRGFINVYSEPGEGATFKVYIPRRVGPDEEARSVESESLPRGGTETVLIVEDEPAILKLSRKMLEKLGYSVLTAASPGEALQVAAEQLDGTDLLIVDIVMPEMNGRDLARELTLRKPGLKCLFMSGYTSDVIARHGVLDEGVYIITKPFSLKVLADKVRAVLDRSTPES